MVLEKGKECVLLHYRQLELVHPRKCNYANAIKKKKKIVILLEQETEGSVALGKSYCAILM